MVLRWCCSLGYPLYNPCTSLIYPLYIPYLSLVHPLSIPCTSLIYPLYILSTPTGTSVAYRCHHRAPDWFWRHWFGRHAHELAFLHESKPVSSFFLPFPLPVNDAPPPRPPPPTPQ